MSKIEAYDITRYEVAVHVDGTTYSFGHCYPKSRSAMIRLFRTRAKSQAYAKAISALPIPESMPWIGKQQRWTDGKSWLGFSGRTERDAEREPLRDILAAS